MTPYAPGTLRVLVIDSNPGDRRLLRALLNDDPAVQVEVLEASNAEDGVEIVRRERLDAILLDLNLGVTNGLDTLRLTRRLLGGLPILVHTGMSDEAAALRSLQLGAADYIIKGEETGRSLRRTIRMVCQRERLVGELLDREADLRAREAQLTDTSELVDDGLVCVDSSGCILEANSAAVRFLGRDTSEVVGVALGALIPELSWLPLAGPEQTHARRRIRLCTTSGDLHELEVTVRRTARSGDTVWLVRLADITGEVAAQEAMRRLEEEYELLLNSAGQAILGVDPGGDVTFANPAAQNLLSQDGNSLIGQTLAQAVPTTGEGGNELAHAVQRGTPLDMEIRLEGRNGVGLPVQVTVRPMFSSGHDRGAVVILDDLTERRQLEAQLRQAQKMEVIGQLAGGIAHDFNNELAVVGLNLAMLRYDWTAGKPADPELMNEIREALDRATRITRQLLNMSRKAELNMRSVDLTAVVVQLEGILRRLIPETIDVRTVVGDADGTVRIDEGALQQALLNLCTNARDAMPDGGELTLTLDRRRVEAGHVATGPVGERPVPGWYHVVSVEDTGTGMPPEVVNRALEPFFTTKPKERGTGLGLPMVYGIVLQMGGFLEVESEVGSGTVFRIFLPTEVSGATPVRDTPEAVWEGDGGGAVVLIVEDEAPLRRACRSALERNGFSTLEASNGREALDVFASTLDGIDVVVSDHVMPEMSGAELYRRLRAQWGPVPFVLTTGYSNGLPADLADVPVLQKPWDMTTLLDTVWGELHRLDPTRLTGS